MKLHSSLPSGVNTITGYGEGYVMVNGQRRDTSVVVLPDRVEIWAARSFEALTADDFSFLKSVAKATPKLTIPSPSMVHYRGGRAAIDPGVYPDIEEFWQDLEQVYAAAF